MVRKLKTISSLIVVISLLLCVFSGCSSKSENAIVGKWYNEKGRCLDIRSDGTYKLEDNYGTGTWKLLDDKQTYEFLDFYGDSQESKINVDDLGKYIDFGYYGDFYKDSFPSLNDQNTTDKSQTDTNETDTGIQILRVKPTGNFFRVRFKKEDKKYCGIANGKGEVFYYTEDNSGSDSDSTLLDFTPISDNAGYLCESIDGKTVYTVINTAGNKKTFTEDDFDKIVYEGGGYILVYKNTGDITKEEHSYGVINSNGEWEIELMPGVKLPNYGKYYYVGEKVFVWNDNADKYVVFDCAENNTIEFAGCNIMSPTVYKGKFIVYSSGWLSRYGMPYGSKSNDLPKGCFMFGLDGSYEQLKNIKYGFDKIAIYEENEHIQIWNLENNSVAQYDEYAANVISNIKFIGNYGLLIIRGLDGKNYFTVIDENGEQQFDPRVYENDVRLIKFYGDRTIYKTQDDYSEMIDNEGNVIISKDKQLTSMSISGDIVNGSNGNNYMYFDKNGNEINFSLSE